MAWLLTAAPSAGAQALLAPSLAVDTAFGPTAGAWSTGFSTGTSSTSPNTARGFTAAVAVDGNRIYTVAETRATSGGRAIAVVARRTDGTPDMAFGDDGRLTLGEGFGTGIVVLPNGAIRVLGATQVSTSSSKVTVLGLTRDGSPDTSFGDLNADGSARTGRVVFDPGPHRDIPARIEAAPNGRLAIIGSRSDGTGDDVFVSLREANGMPVPGFGTGGVAFSARPSEVDRGIDVAFLPGGGLVALSSVDPTASANDTTAVLQAFTSNGNADTSFSGGKLSLAPIDPGLARGGVLVHDGRVWVAGHTKVATGTHAFLARVNADGTDLEFRQFEMRRPLVQPTQAVMSRAFDLVVVPGAPETLVAVGSVEYTSQGSPVTDWTATAFNGLDGALADARTGDILLPASRIGDLVSAAAGPQGWLAVTGTYLASEITFATARLLVNVDKACDLAVTVGEPGEVVFHGLRPAALTARVQNVGSRPCAGTLSAPPPYGMAPVGTGLVAPGATFTAAALPVSYHGARRADDVLQIRLDAPADVNPDNNRGAAHVVFSYCDLAVELVGRNRAIPTEGARRFQLSLRNNGTATCRVRVGSKRPYPLARGRAASDVLAVAVPKGSRPGRRVAVVLRAHATDDVNPADNSVTVSPQVVKVGDSNLLRWGARGLSGTARRGSGDLPSGRLRPARVHVALLREHGGGCSWLNSARGGFTKPKRRRGGDCRGPRWLPAAGKTSWRFTLRSPLPPGRYVAYSRATIGAGFPEARFSAKDRNRVAFRVG